MYVDWTYYNNNFPLVPEETFDALIGKAERVVLDYIPQPRLAVLEPGWKMEKLKACICFVVNKLYENSINHAEDGIKSVSNDGYSESYDNKSQQQITEELYNLIFARLSGTGLLGVM